MLYIYIARRNELCCKFVSQNALICTKVTVFLSFLYIHENDKQILLTLRSEITYSILRITTFCITYNAPYSDSKTKRKIEWVYTLCQNWLDDLLLIAIILHFILRIDYLVYHAAFFSLLRIKLELWAIRLTKKTKNAIVRSFLLFKTYRIDLFDIGCLLILIQWHFDRFALCNVQNLNFWVDDISHILYKAIWLSYTELMEMTKNSSVGLFKVRGKSAW